jgi:GTP-binding protein EngB required for normal cell division
LPILVLSAYYAISVLVQQRAITAQSKSWKAHKKNSLTTSTKQFTTTQQYHTTMETLKRPSEIIQGPPKKRLRQYYEQLHQMEMRHRMLEAKRDKLKRHQQKEKVKFAVFLKYLLHHLDSIDKEKSTNAKQASIRFFLFNYFSKKLIPKVCYFQL